MEQKKEEKLKFVFSSLFYLSKRFEGSKTKKERR